MSPTFGDANTLISRDFCTVMCRWCAERLVSPVVVSAEFPFSNASLASRKRIGRQNGSGPFALLLVIAPAGRGNLNLLLPPGVTCGDCKIANARAPPLQVTRAAGCMRQQQRFESNTNYESILRRLQLKSSVVRVR